MFAVIKTGGKQFRVAAADVITIPKLDGEAGSSVTFDEVLLLGRDGSTDVGTPAVAGASVGAEIVEQTRGPKVIAFKKRRRKNSRRKRGHRQDLTVVRVGSIALHGEVLARAEAPVRRTRAADAEQDSQPLAESAPSA